ncbi:MAG: hypothetical protein A07HR60_02578 [uncultured archaeon A07HR60]|nr:MAG: hypothetical protein A07HR60_02578 [uncultured archaeon A07HR60]
MKLVNLARWFGWSLIPTLTSLKSREHIESATLNLAFDPSQCVGGSQPGFGRTRQRLIAGRDSAQRTGDTVCLTNICHSKIWQNRNYDHHREPISK